ncbi:hypothetical protein Lal_00042343 [Lupinus albus]|nr:hypothetical protein Lal_00042343 [Lupinus albus]
MASSSRSKKQHSNVTQSKQGTSSLESNPLDLTRLLANDEQCKVFQENFHGRTIFTPIFVHYAVTYPLKVAQRVSALLTVRGTQSPLPNAIFITNILEHFDVSTAGETKVALNLRESKIDVDVVHKMGFFVDPRDRRTYKHRIDRPTAPTTQLEPANPNPSEFHAQSSSSAAMPSNQMIMDELFLLRGYISNRMDALDIQNQQIQYELYRLSSKLSSMDNVEDNSEPES